MKPVVGQSDVVVIGSGPAGSTAAQLLSDWGWSVVLVHHDAGRPSLAESLPASARKVFAFVGQLPRIEAAAFHPNRGNVACWAGELRATPTSDAGFHVSRRLFDAVLRESAAAAGAVLAEGTVRRVDHGEPLRVTFASRGSARTLHARLVLDCSGRAGVVARRGWRRPGTSYGTLAIAAEWDCPSWPEAERLQTLVESYADGWAWSVPLSATRRQCTVMIDLDRRGAAKRRPRDHYGRELARTTELRARLAAARQSAAPWACDASVYDCVRAAGDNVLLVGDAASFIEPLSSAGVKKAMLSAWRAAVVANTCLKDQSRAAAAFDFYDRRERAVYGECARRSARFFTEAAAVHRSPFWAARADGEPCADQDDGGGELSDDALARDGEVRRAFEYLRAAERVRLRAAESLRIASIAAIEGREVVMRDALLVPGHDAPLRSAAGVDLPALAGLARGGGDVPGLIDAYHRRIGPVPVSGLLAGLSLLVARRALVAEVSSR